MKGHMNKISGTINDICTIWIDETKKIFRDEGLLIFTILLPLLYPLLYSWIYNNEVVRDVPVAIVDKSNSELSRKLISRLDASPDVETAYRCGSLEEAQRLVGLQEVYGIVYIPENFDTRINRMEQSTVSLYCNMALMLTYKAIYQTSTAVIAGMNSDIQKSLTGNYTDREDEITTSPIDIEEVAMFNSTGGYGSFILPGVLILIIQQVLLLSIGMRNGTINERRPSKPRRDFTPKPTGLVPVVAGKTMCYLALFTILATYVLLAIPRIFNFVHILHAGDFVMFLLPYLLACIFFAMTVSVFIKERHAAGCVHISAAAFHLRHIMANKQHTRILEIRVLHIPFHIRHTGIYQNEQHGSDILRHNIRICLPLDTSCRISHHGMPGIQKNGSSSERQPRP